MAPMRPDPAPESIDWPTLERLRRLYLNGRPGAADYWRTEKDLAAYDATFAQRIGWKWDFVLHDLARRGWSPPGGELLDWACGSGIAARAFLDHFGTDRVSGLRFFDRSPLAMRFARDRASARFPQIPLSTGGAPTRDLLLLSHVLTELDTRPLDGLLALVRQATAILWVEPGTHAASRALIAVRERLRQDFNPVAPCLHAAACGLTVADNVAHWCHHFATPPPGVFTDPFWGRFAERLGIDLRSVPLSYLVLDRRPPPPPPPGAVRTLGRPRLSKAELRVMVCRATGVSEQTLTRRQFPEAWHQARKERFESIQILDHPA